MLARKNFPSLHYAPTRAFIIPLPRCDKSFLSPITAITIITIITVKMDATIS